MPDLPPISQDLNDPLPTVDPNSDLVPYRTSHNEPGQAPVVTTGYAARARPPIQPPDGFGGGVGFPSLDRIYQAAFSQLPVDEAVKAVGAATKFMGQRMLSQALEQAKTPEEMNNAYGKYGYLAFGGGGAVPEILRAQIERERLKAPQLREAGGGLYRIPNAGPAETVVAPKPPAPSYHSVGGRLYRTTPQGEALPITPAPIPKPEPLSLSEQEELKDAYREQDEARKDLAKNAENDLDDKSLMDAQTRFDQAQKRIAKFRNPAQTRVKVKNKEGKIGTIPADRLDKALEAGFTEVK